MAASRTAAQKRASAENLKKARAHKKRVTEAKKWVKGNGHYDKAGFAANKEQTAKWVKSGQLPASAKQRRQERTGGRSWAAREAGGSMLPKSAFKKGSRVRVSGVTGKRFTQSHRQAIQGIRVQG